MQEKSDPLDFRSFLLPSSSLREVSCHQAPRSMESCHPFIPPRLHSLVPSPDLVAISGVGEITIFRITTYGVPNRLYFCWQMMLKSSVEQKRSSLGLLHRPKRTPPLATRTTVQEMGRRIDDLYNRQEQTP